MVRKALKVNSALELNDASVCVQQGTTTELNLADYFRANNMALKTVTFATADEAVKAYDTGRCDAYTTDSSGLYGERLRLADPSRTSCCRRSSPRSRSARRCARATTQWDRYRALDALTPCSMPRNSASTQSNVDEMTEIRRSGNRAAARRRGPVRRGLGLTKDWAYRIIKAVGNYGEMFERNVGQGSPLKIARGLNALWTKGGLQYGLPIR